MENVYFKLRLGAKVRDKVSGLKGTVVSRSENLNGCKRYTIQPKVGDDGKHPDAYWFDEDQIELIHTGVNIPKTGTGGPPGRAPSNKV